MANTPDVDDIREAYVAKRVGELMTPRSKQDDVEAIAEEEFNDWLDQFKSELLDSMVCGTPRTPHSFTMPPWSDTLNGGL